MGDATTIRVLGSGGWFPTASRATCCCFLRQGRSAVAVDAGSGLARLLQHELLEGVDELHIVLTHFHLDHLIGLAVVPALREGRTVTIRGPGRALYGASTDEILGRIVTPPVLNTSLERLADAIDEIGPGSTTVGPFSLHVRTQTRHSAPTLAFRFDDVLTWCTDTAFDQGNVAFAAGCRVLAHEAWSPSGSPLETLIHTTGLQAATVADEAGVEHLRLMHLHPLHTVDDVLQDARARFPGAELTADGGLLPT